MPAVSRPPVAALGARARQRLSLLGVTLLTSLFRISAGALRCDPDVPCPAPPLRRHPPPAPSISLTETALGKAEFVLLEGLSGHLLVEQPHSHIEPFVTHLAGARVYGCTGGRLESWHES